MFNRTKLIYMSVLPLIIAISGCAQLNSQFDCPMKPGIRCESLDQVNARVDRGEIGYDDLETVNSYKTNMDIPTTDVPNRVNESVLRVWIAPFEDDHSNYHEESIVYTISQPGRWVNHSKVITTRSEESDA